MTTWTGQAQILADDIREPGFGAAAAFSSACKARVDPQALHGLAGAAVALLGNDALTALFGDVPPCPDDKTLLRQTAEREGAVAELLEWCRRMARECRADMEAAYAALAGAGAALADAESQLAAAVTAAQTAAAENAIAAAMGAQADALARIADCETALEILAEVEDRLIHALNCLRRVPDDLGSTYEVPYKFVHDGGKLPHDGDFLTGQQAA